MYAFHVESPAFEAGNPTFPANRAAHSRILSANPEQLPAKHQPRREKALDMQEQKENINSRTEQSSDRIIFHIPSTGCQPANAGKGETMITSVLCILFVSAAVAACMVIAGSWCEAMRLHGKLRADLSVCGSTREVRVRNIELRVHATVTQLPLPRGAALTKRSLLSPDLPLAA
jgi:hypothetical protein